MTTPQAPYTFPAPIGGVPFDMDFVPSIIIAFMYASIVNVGIYRLVRASSRTLCTLGSLIFASERVLIFGLRAHQAHDPSESASNFLTQYWQMTFAIGYLTMIVTVYEILRCLLVNTTLGTTPGILVGLPSSDADSEANYSLLNKSGAYGLPQDEDQPRERALYRRVCGYLALFTYVPIIIGVAQGALYTKAEKETDGKGAAAVYVLRYVCTSIAFMQLAIFQGLCIWAYTSIPRIRRGAVLILASIAALLTIVSAYRLVVMRLKTTSLTSLGPHSLNDPESKRTFYIFHAVPEVLAAAILFSVNVREVFGTGMFGDKAKKSKSKASN